MHDDLSWQHTKWHPLEETLQGESSVVPQLHEDPWWHWQPADWHHLEGTLQGESSVVPQLHEDPQWLWQPPLEETLQGESVVPQLHEDPRWHWQHANWQDELSGAPPLPDDLWWHTIWAPPGAVGETLYDGSLGASSTTSGASQLQNDPPPAWGSSQVHDDPPPALGTPQLHDDGSKEFDSSYRWYSDFHIIEGASSSSDLESEARPLHSETLPPLEAEAPQPLEAEVLQPLEAEASQPSEAEVSQPLGAEASQPLEVEAPQPLEAEAPQPLEVEAPQPSESEALPSAPETHTFFNDALRQELKVYAGVGAVAGISLGLALGVDKMIKNHSHGSYVSAFFHPSLTNI